MIHTLFSPPNLLSLMRGPLALLFYMQENPFYRCMALILAIFTDIFDGYLARRYQMTSRMGTLIDPLMDKLFVFVVLAVFISEQRLDLWEAAAMLGRDFAVILFGIYLMATGYWSQYRFRAILCGKVTTALQLTVLIGLTLQYAIPYYIYILFIALGFLSLIELYLVHVRSKLCHSNSR